MESGDIVALAPYASRFPFETWFLPRQHGARFEDAPRQQYESLARALKNVLMRFDRTLESPAYNLIVHSTPFAEPIDEIYHWHVELTPKLTRLAGFEWGTGFHINAVSPEEASTVLRKVKV
jgi:UDPglucose--hexose-1-phosphate uridylyltransferase